MKRHAITWILAAWTLCFPLSAASREPTAQESEFFEKNVRPVLAEHCFKCHGTKTKQHSELILDNRNGMLKGGVIGPAVVPGKPEESLLVAAIHYGDDLQMPPTGKLEDRQIADLTRWVQMGAPWPTTPVASVEKRHWSFRPIESHSLPSVRQTDWPRSSIDYFILARLEAAGLAPAAEAEKRTWLRRATYDLTGLPPTPAEIGAFLADDSRRAYDRAAERLLASPAFGEHWARHWLDLMRYAETRGHEFDYPIPNAYQYRDYVIRAFNADVPYHQFVIEHIAGDLLAEPRRNFTTGANESVLGTGFWFLGEEVHSPVDIRADETDRIDNKLDVLGKAFLGLTVACARCHDHKFDPIPTADYYALAGFVLSSGYRQVRFESIEKNKQTAMKLEQFRRSAGPKLVKLLVDAQKPVLRRMSDYLLAARDALRLGPTTTSRRPDIIVEGFSKSFGDQIAKLAQERGLSPELLSRWVPHLLRARQQRSSPLFLWSQVADDNALQAQSFDSLLVQTKVGAECRDTLPVGAKVVVDYANLQPEDWIQDGFGFGTGPAQPGDLLLGNESSQPLVGVVDRTAASFDPAWNRLELADGTQGDPARLSAWVRAGRTLRTRTFTLTTGKLYYLVKGSANVYAPVDSHRLNNGPLHGALIRKIAGDDRFRWIEHDLSDYRGHRVHIEFSPNPSDNTSKEPTGGLAIAMIVEADQKPDDPVQAHRLLREAVADVDEITPSTVAKAYERVFLGVAERLRSGSISACNDPKSHAQIADWIVRNRLLFLTAKSQQRVSHAAKEIVAEQNRLVESIQIDSRTAPAMLDGSGVDEHVLLRGKHQTVGPLAPRRFLTAIAGTDQPEFTLGSGRLELAHWMTDPSNPFAARVMVNRIWHHLFGTGIVPTVDNFGALGQPPSHPKLLDYLAARFIRENWSVKRLVRMIVLSSTYRSSSRPNVVGARKDPSNKLLHHMPIRRLSGESIRDTVLAISGRLDRRMFGPGVPIHLTKFMEGRGKPADSGPLDGNGRRSIYVEVRRNFLSPMMLTFDSPIPFSAMGRRSISNVPAQALILMNDPFIAGQSKLWARRALASHGTSDRQRIRQLFASAFGRLPNDMEIEQAITFLHRQASASTAVGGDSERTLLAWADLCHALINVKEFIFVK